MKPIPSKAEVALFVIDIQLNNISINVITELKGNHYSPV